MTATSLKAQQFWAEMRSTCYLWSKSNYPTAEHTRQLISELDDILGQRITTYPPVMAKYGIEAGVPYAQKKKLLGVDKLYDNSMTLDADVRFMNFMANKAAQAQKGNWSWRITEEAQQKQLAGWYPFFVTLTVDPKMCCGQTHRFKGREVKYDSVQDLWSEGREFRLYIRSLAKVVAQCLGHPPPHKKTKEYGYRPESDYVTYAGVIEHGKSQEHHHAHIMIWLREIPSLWKKDPNEGKIPGYRSQRECIPLRKYWPWCISTQKPALYFRAKGDIWSELGHVSPTDGREALKNGKPNPEFRRPIKINPVSSVGNYVTKYMQKGTKVWHHRMKCTRNLGLQRIQQILRNLDSQTVAALSWKPKNSRHRHLASLTHSVPVGLLNSLAKRQIFSDRWQKGQLDLKALMKTNYGHYSAMLKSVRDGARPDRMPSHQFYDWVQQFLPVEKEYSKKRLLLAHQALAKEFPKPKIRVTPIVIPDTDYGSTQCI